MQRKFLGLLLAIVLSLGLGQAYAAMPTEDRAGNPISVPETVSTIVSLSPSITQVILDLGMGDKLVAVDTYSMDTKGLPEGLLAFDMMSPDMEQIVALAPDLVLVTGMALVSGDDPFVKLQELGTAVAIIPSSDSLAGIQEDVRFIGTVVGNEAGAQALNDTLSEAIEAYRVTTDTPVSVYFEISALPNLYSFGSGTFLNEMIELLGGQNIFADQQGWLSISEEAVIQAAPEIIFTNMPEDMDAVDGILARNGWGSVPAVESGRVYQVDPDSSSQSNHRVVKALEEMAAAMAE